MAWGFRKSISLGKLLRVNVSHSGIGISAGVPGLRVSLGADGKVRRPVSIPGTGIRNSAVLNSGGSQRAVLQCPHCSQRIAKSDRFCRRCGQKL